MVILKWKTPGAWAALSLVFALLLLPAKGFSQGTWTPSRVSLETGGLVYLSCAQRAQVVVDGIALGSTPILLELKPGGHDLDVFSRDKIFRRRLVASPASSPGRLDRVEAVLAPYTGRLWLLCPFQGALLSVDGSPPAPVGDRPLELTEGSHRVLVWAEARASCEAEVEVPRDASVELRIELGPSYTLRFAAAPPKGSRLLVLDGEGRTVRNLDPLAPAALAGGLTRFRLLFPAGQSLEFSWNPASADPAQISLSGRLVLAPLTKDAAVEIDGAPAPSSSAEASPSQPRTAPAEELERTYELAPGLHAVKVRKPGYMPFSFFCEIGPGSESRPKLLLLKDIALERAKKNALGLPILASGGLLVAGGLVLNTDSTAIALSSDYSGYKLLKYLGLGAMGAGLVTFLSGLGVVVL